MTGLKPGGPSNGDVQKASDACALGQEEELRMLVNFDIYFYSLGQLKR